MMQDPIVEAVDRASEKLLEQHGGIHGLIAHLQTLDRERVRKAKRAHTPKVPKRRAKKVVVR